MTKPTVVFIHGLWLHADSWQSWQQFFNAHGYPTLSVPWPGDSATVETCRTNPNSIANRGVKEIAESIAGIVATLDQPPILIGHSFGGLLTQILLARGIAAAGVAIDPAPIKGVWQLPFSALRASFPILANPLNYTKAKSLTFPQFRYGFANAISIEEGRAIYDQWTIPAPCKPLFQAALATIVGSDTKADSKNTSRGPLLITGGEKDHTAPPIFGKAAAKKYPTAVTTDFVLFKNRGHSLILDSGWPEIAEYALRWLETHVIHTGDDFRI